MRIIAGPRGDISNVYDRENVEVSVEKSDDPIFLWSSVMTHAFSGIASVDIAISTSFSFAVTEARIMEYD